MRLHCVLQVVLGGSHWNCYIMDAILMLGYARKHGVFSGKRRSRCGEKYARARDGLRHRRFSVESFSVLAVRLSRCSRSSCPVVPFPLSRFPFPFGPFSRFLLESCSCEKIFVFRYHFQLLPCGISATFSPEMMVKDQQLW